jgi:CDP-diacylglycerol--glycerol-3-phosphate 3-phosphatidyltransferase
MAGLPWMLVWFRALCAPVLVALAWRDASHGVLVVVFVAAFLSDIFDGVIARRAGTATAELREADTAVDTVFYVCAAGTLYFAAPGALQSIRHPLVALVTIHVSRGTFELAKFGRFAAYHMWSSKLWGAVLAAGFTHAFAAAGPSPLLRAAAWLGILNELEGFTISIVLPRWQHDVPSLVHALRLR